jgi:YHS domain-containing protein/thiol-disulfide isomerase/thioredoxin
MRKIGKIYRLSLAVAGFLAIASTGRAQQPLHWELSIDAAKQIAARSNRLVLVEFTAPWCGQCRAMEAEVFGQPGVAGVIEANYVPVRINVDYAAQTAKQYGITGLPTTVILAPTARGEVLDSIPGRMEVVPYLTRLNRLAVAVKRPAAAPVARIAGGSPPAATAPLGLDGYCPVQLVEKQAWARGDARWGAIHQGRTYLFAGADQQRRFFADPDRYAPVNGGNDVVLTVEQKQVVPGCRQHGVYYVGHVYLFRDEASLAKFRKDPRYYAERVAAAASPPSTAQQARRD